MLWAGQRDGPHLMYLLPLAPRCCSCVAGCSQSGGPDRRNLCSALVAHRGMAVWRACARGEKRKRGSQTLLFRRGAPATRGGALEHAASCIPARPTLSRNLVALAGRTAALGALAATVGMAVRIQGADSGHQSRRWYTNIPTSAACCPCPGPARSNQTRPHQALQPAAANDRRQGPGPPGGIPVPARPWTVDTAAPLTGVNWPLDRASVRIANANR